MKNLFKVMMYLVYFCGVAGLLLGFMIINSTGNSEQMDNMMLLGLLMAPLGAWGIDYHKYDAYIESGVGERRRLSRA